MIVSDCPPGPPSTQNEYMSAVSMKLNPASVKASSILKDPFSSSVHPKTLVPRLSGATSRLVSPILILLIFIFYWIQSLIYVSSGRLPEYMAWPELIEVCHTLGPSVNTYGPRPEPKAVCHYNKVLGQIISRLER